ncbi:MAG: mechanosensitive ion channel family protein [Rhodobacteraceae bacterium]|nr:mechanosensitive ion channel family protein [Paracoccaceae bacterium]
MIQMRYLWAALLLLACLVMTSMASAQITVQNRQIYQNWLATAERAEHAIDTGRASDAALEYLRAEIVDFREIFTLTSKKNAARILTLRSQIAALGPVPENGTESHDLVVLRERITNQMNDSLVPVVIAQEAHNRANGLIGEIDRIIRKRHTKRLLARGESPLKPENWAPAWRDLAGAWSAIVNETGLIVQSQIGREQAYNNIVKVSLLAIMGVLLLTLGRRWAEKIGETMRKYGGRGTGIWSFVVSIFRVLLPYFGLVALTQALSATGMAGLRGTLLLNAIPLWSAVMMGFIWLSDRLYSQNDEDALLPIASEYRPEARLYVRLLAVMLILNDALGLYGKVENISEASSAVAAFPLILMTSVVLLRLRRIAYLERIAHTDKMSTAAKRAGLSIISPIISRVGTLVGFVAPVLAAIGYSAAAEALIYPTVVTLALFSLILILNKFVSDVYGWLTGSGTSGQDSLFPALAGFALALMSLPLLALIWGARVADLTELWARFMNGYQVGDSRISPTDFVTFVVIFIIGYSVTRMLQKTLKNNLLPKTSLDPGGQVAVASGVGYVGIFLAALIAVSGVGLDLSSLAIVAGALSVGIGFGLQNIVSNFVSGVILLIERPISEGDWIEVSGHMGYVRNISVRSTRIETFDRFDVIVPNADLVSGTVTNYTRGNTIGRVIVPVGVAYGTDTRMIEELLLEIANAHPMVLANPAPSVAFQGFGASSLDFEIRAILRDVNWMLSVKSDMNHEIARRFAQEGIEIPFEQRDIWLRNPEALAGKPEAQTSKNTENA